jgi:hypothetical protein
MTALLMLLLLLLLLLDYYDDVCMLSLLPHFLSTRHFIISALPFPCFQLNNDNCCVPVEEGAGAEWASPLRRAQTAAPSSTHSDVWCR